MNVAGIKRDGASEALLGRNIPGVMNPLTPLQKAVIGVPVLGRLLANDFNGARRTASLQRDGNGRGDFVLDTEDLLGPPIVALCPQMPFALGIDELCRDPNVGADLAHTAFDHVTNAQLPPDRGDIDGRAAELEG